MASDSLVFRTAERHVSNYTRESSDLMAEHREAMDCRDCEAFLQLAIEAFRWLIRADLDLRIAAGEGIADYNASDDDRLRQLCRDWLVPCAYAEQWIARQLERGYRIENLAEFRMCCEEMRAIVKSFDDADGDPLPPGLIELRDRAIEEHLRGETSEFI